MRPDRATLQRLLDVAWKVPFVLAAALMVGAGIAQSLGRTGVPPLAALLALALAAVGLVLAVAALWRPRRPRPVQALRHSAARTRARFQQLTRSVRTRKARS